MAPILKVEVAASPEKQQQGLMYRRSLPKDSGMLFDFGSERHLSFWMANTEIPLQIAFVKPDGRIGQLEHMTPLETKPIRSYGPYRYAIEANDGWFDRHGIRIGAQMQMPGQQPQQPVAMVLPAKDILERANAHDDLRLVIAYKGMTTTIRTPFEFVDSQDGRHDAVIKTIIEGPTIIKNPQEVSKDSEPDNRWRSFTIDDITSIHDLSGQPITTPEQVDAIAGRQQRPMDNPGQENIVATRKQGFMKTAFNLKQCLQKKANYEGAQGYFVLQRRAWNNCVRCKLNDQKSAQEAWQECLNEYQKTGNNMEWAAAHLAEKVDRTVEASCSPQMQMGKYWDRIQKHLKEGITMGKAVMETLEECQDDAEKIPHETKRA